jgi:tetratricopeptide (TPR) repeat protein
MMLDPPDSTEERLNQRAALYCLHSGNKYMKMHSWQNAINWLSQAVKIQPHFFEAYCLLGEAYLELYQLEEAVKAFKEASQLRPDDAGPHLKLGHTYIAMNNWNAALGQYHTLRSLNEVIANDLFDRIFYSFNYEMFTNLFNHIYETR